MAALSSRSELRPSPRRRPRSGPALSVGLLLLLAGRPVSAQDAAENDPSSGSAWRSEAVGAVRLQAGAFTSTGDPQLPGLEDGTAWAVAISLFPGPPFPGHILGFDFGVWGVSRSYQTVVADALDPRTPLETQAFHLGARLGLPASGPVTVQALGGFTYADHEMTVQREPIPIFGSIGRTAQDEASGWAPYWGLAADIRVGPVGVGVEKRWVRSAGSLDDPFSMREPALGGSILFFGLGIHGVR